MTSTPAKRLTVQKPNLNKDQLIIISDERLHITQEKDFRLVGMKKVEYERYGGYFAISEPDIEYRYYFKM